MNFAIIYLAHRFFFRLTDFFHHWYVDALRYLMHWFISFLEQLDRFFAVRVTFRFIFQPLWKDYTVIGRIIGFLFRSARVAFGVGVYFICAIFFAGIYLFWIFLPFLVLTLAYRGAVS